MIMANTTAQGECDGGCFSSGKTGEGELHHRNQQLLQQHMLHAAAAATANGNVSSSKPPVPKKKRNLPGTPDPNAEVIALSPASLLARNRFICEICNKGFQRDQNLQLHRRGHNLPWKLRQRASTEVRKRVYVCPETTCVHHNPSRALGDLTGIKKHFCRKHGEKKWKCAKCSKKYAVQSDWKAHSKTCGTREYKCDCGTIFSRRDSFITHRAFCDALAEESSKANQYLLASITMGPSVQPHVSISSNNSMGVSDLNIQLQDMNNPLPKSLTSGLMPMFPSFASSPATFDGKWTSTAGSTAGTSATALLQKASQIGATASSNGISTGQFPSFRQYDVGIMHGNAPYQQSRMAGIDGPGLANALFSDGGINDMGMFSAHAAGMLEGRNRNCRRSGGGDALTVDFLGRRQ